MNNENFIFPPDKMVGEFDDFIGIWKNFIPKQLCKELIEKVDEIQTTSALINDGETGKDQFVNGRMGRHDYACVLNHYDVHLSNIINDYLKCCLKSYCLEYNQLLSVKLMSYAVKAQKTPPGGGYHEWHYENASFTAASRELVWTMYLNTMPEGEAETEFLYQRRRIKPEGGMVVIWPAGLTHVHKGNTVFTEDKYILTGWAHKVQ